MNPLTAAASTLFSLISRIRNRAQHMDPEQACATAPWSARSARSRIALVAGRGQTRQQTVKVARYAICATLDDVVLNTPWGGNSNWGQQSLVATFAQETVGGDRFYAMLQKLESTPAQYLDLLEFIYMCLTLGFEGRLRVEPGGQEKHLAIRQNLARTIRNHRGPQETGLSPNWKGIVAAYRPRAIWLPVWVTLGVLAAILGGTFFGLSYALSGDTGRVTGALLNASVTPNPELRRLAPPPPPPPPPIPVQVERLEKVKGFLKDEIEAGIVSVFEKGNTVTIRIAGTGMFASGSDVLQEAFRQPLEQVAKALNDEPGQVIIAGHSDNIPIQTARFPSNLHLSLERAKSVMEEVAKLIDDPDRLSAEGRADREPIASNDTAAGRAQNRRIEVLLVREEQ